MKNCSWQFCEAELLYAVDSRMTDTRKNALQWSSCPEMKLVHCQLLFIIHYIESFCIYVAFLSAIRKVVFLWLSKSSFYLPFLCLPEIPYNETPNIKVTRFASCLEEFSTGAPVVASVMLLFFFEFLHIAVNFHRLERLITHSICFTKFWKSSLFSFLRWLSNNKGENWSEHYELQTIGEVEGKKEDKEDKEEREKKEKEKKRKRQER